MAGYRCEPLAGMDQELRERLALLLRIASDGILLIGWLCVQWGFDFATRHIPENGALDWLAAKVIFAVGTLAVIANYVYWDIRAKHAEYRARYLRRRAAARQAAREVHREAD